MGGGLLAGCVMTYRLSGWSKQALSIPGNDIIASVRGLELGFWLLEQKQTVLYPFNSCRAENALPENSMVMIESPHFWI